ncbi:MAG: hypothetical protein ACLPPF_11290 [Rhodomicrobium sp.]
MRQTTDYEKAPAPGDIDGWRNAPLSRLRPEDIVRAAQDPKLKAERFIYNALMQHLSGLILRAVRAGVHRGWNNGGQDIVDDVHDNLIAAVLRPTSADGNELGQRFWAVLKTRTIDAVRNAAKERDRFTTYEDEIAEDPEREAADSQARIDEKIDYERVLERLLESVPDPRKRLAYRLHLQGVPRRTTKGTTSISEAIGVSAKTVGEWIDEVEAIVKAKIGGRHD